MKRQDPRQSNPYVRLRVIEACDRTIQNICHERETRHAEAIDRLMRRRKFWLFGPKPTYDEAVAMHKEPRPWDWGALVMSEWDEIECMFGRQEGLAYAIRGAAAESSAIYFNLTVAEADDLDWGNIDRYLRRPMFDKQFKLEGR